MIPAGKDAGEVTRTYTGIAAGADCSAVETVDGHTDTVGVESAGGKESVVVPANGTATAKLVDTYSDEEGSLIVEKTISGDAAGSQGPVTIQVSCDKGTPSLPDFDIGAGTGAGSVSKTYPRLAGGRDLLCRRDGRRRNLDGARRRHDRPTRGDDRCR